MTVQKRKVFLITEAQRDALLTYLQERPYKEVASGIQFLMNAPSAMLNIETNEEETATLQEAAEAAPAESEVEALAGSAAG